MSRRRRKTQTKRRRLAAGVCTYCGSHDDLTDDHVFPKALFPRPLPTNLITVPACSECNREFSRHEAHFRNVLAQLQGTDSHPAAQRLIQTRIQPRLRENPSQVRQLRQSMSWVDVSQGGIYLGTKPAFKLSEPGFELIISKIIKGLLYFHTGHRCRDNYELTWFPLHAPMQLHPYIIRSIYATQSILGDRVVDYGRFVWPGSPTSVWMIVFFGGAAFFGNVLAPLPKGAHTDIFEADILSLEQPDRKKAATLSGR